MIDAGNFLKEQCKTMTAGSKMSVVIVLTERRSTMSDNGNSALEEFIEQSFGSAGAAFYRKFGGWGCLVLLIIVAAVIFGMLKA